MKKHLDGIFWFRAFLGLSLALLFLSGCARRSRIPTLQDDTAVNIIPSTLPSNPTANAVASPGGQLVLNASPGSVQEANQPIILTTQILSATQPNVSQFSFEFIGLNASLRQSGTLSNGGELRVTSVEPGTTILRVRAVIDSFPVEVSITLNFTQPLNCRLYSQQQNYQGLPVRVGEQTSFFVIETSSGQPLRTTHVWTQDPSEQAFFPFSYGSYPALGNQFNMIFRSAGYKTVFVRAQTVGSSSGTRYCTTQLDLYVNPPSTYVDVCLSYPYLCYSNQGRRCSFAAEWVGIRNADCGRASCNKRVEASLPNGIILPSDAQNIQMRITSLYLDNDDKRARIKVNGSEVIRETQDFYNSVPNVSIGHLLRGGSNAVDVSVISAKRYWSAVFTVSGEYYTQSRQCTHSFGYR